MPYCDECIHYVRSINGSPVATCSCGHDQYDGAGPIASCENDFNDFVSREPTEDVDLPAPPRGERPSFRGITISQDIHEGIGCGSEEIYIAGIPKKKVKKKEKKKPYKSQDGFELVPLHRGFTEIIPLWEIINDVINRHKADVFICGGYARWCASPKYEPVKAGDIDIYSETKKVHDRLFGRLIHDNNLKVKNENEMAITFEHPNSGAFHYMPPIQLIKPIKDGSIVAKGNKKTILSNFDFTIIRAAIESPDSVMVDKDFLHDETHNILRLKNIHCPVSSLLRCLKYVKKGYWLRPMEAAKLFTDWMNREEGYRSKILDYIVKADAGEGLSQEEVDELERLMRID